MELPPPALMLQPCLKRVAVVIEDLVVVQDKTSSSGGHNAKVRVPIVHHGSKGFLSHQSNKITIGTNGCPGTPGAPSFPLYSMIAYG